MSYLVEGFLSGSFFSSFCPLQILHSFHMVPSQHFLKLAIFFPLSFYKINILNYLSGYLLVSSSWFVVRWLLSLYTELPTPAAPSSFMIISAPCFLCVWQVVFRIHFMVRYFHLVIHSRLFKYIRHVDFCSMCWWCCIVSQRLMGCLQNCTKHSSVDDTAFIGRADSLAVALCVSECECGASTNSCWI